MAHQVLKIVTLRCVLPALLLLPRLASAQALKPEEIYQQLLPSVLTLQVANSQGERFVGSAFFALSNNLAVTSWHVISDATNVTARLADNHPVSVLGLVDKDEKHDLALIRLGIADRLPVCLNTNTPAIGSRTYVIGAPKGFEFSITDGLLSQIQKVDGYDQFQVSCPISGGNSGGPLINDCGEVIGVTSWTKRDAQNLSFATPALFLSRLNPALPAVPWAKPAPAPKPVAKIKSSPDESVSASVKPAAPENNVRDLQQFLQTSVGKHLTVFIIDDGDEKEFDIIVPQDLVKTP
jgi:serine protease Do